ncbi:MAG: alpha/beta fold hydrolase [Cyanobacteria bacterium P01_F01_bin.42]
MSSALICLKPNPSAEIRLVCLPHAGGSAQIFQDWTRRLPLWIELWAVELPGRGRRWGEQPIAALSQLVPDLSAAIADEIKKPFALFGHSMGGLIAFELAHTLQQQAAPLGLYVSAAEAPQSKPSKPPIHGLPTPEFIAELRRYDGTPAAILENEEMMELLLPTLRSDFSLLETYEYRPGQMVSCPIVAFSGREDDIVSYEAMQQWAHVTTASFLQHDVVGDHFFVQTPDFVERLLMCLTQMIRG